MKNIKKQKSFDNFEGIGSHHLNSLLSKFAKQTVGGDGSSDGTPPPPPPPPYTGG